MKVKMYMDVYQGWKPECACAVSNPSIEKPAGFKRLSFVVEIPDYLEQTVDVKIQETSVAREIK
jgi:hypothetical protein